MLMTLAGMVILVRLIQLENAPDPILVTLSGIMIFYKFETPENAWSPMLVTLSGMTVLIHPSINMFP